MTEYDIDGETQPVASAPGGPIVHCCQRLAWDCKCISECDLCGQLLRGQLACGDCHGGRP